MRRRFTGKTRVRRGSIPKKMRVEIYQRDSFTCQFCQKKFDANDLTIDHLVPLALGGLDEMINYVTCCRRCNTRKADMPLEEFAREMNINVEDLPVHGDTVIDNDKLPIQIRILRKRLYDQVRMGDIKIKGTSAKQKLEKTYRREFWSTEIGRQLESEEPSLPGHVRVMIPEIKTIAKSAREYRLLIELAKSAQTRDFIGEVLTPGIDIEARVRSMAKQTKNHSLRKRLNQSLDRFEKSMRRYEKRR